MPQALYHRRSDAPPPVRTDPILTTEGCGGWRATETRAHSTRAALTPGAHSLGGTDARICEVSPLLCLNCGGQKRIIAFITDSADITPLAAPKAKRPRSRSRGRFLISANQRLDSGRPALRVFDVLINLVEVQMHEDRRVVLDHDAHGVDWL